MTDKWGPHSEQVPLHSEQVPLSHTPVTPTRAPQTPRGASTSPAGLLRINPGKFGKRLGTISGCSLVSSPIQHVHKQRTAISCALTPSLGGLITLKLIRLRIMPPQTDHETPLWATLSSKSFSPAISLVFTPDNTAASWWHDAGLRRCMLNVALLWGSMVSWGYDAAFISSVQAFPFWNS